MLMSCWHHIGSRVHNTVAHGPTTATMRISDSDLHDAPSVPRDHLRPRFGGWSHVFLPKMPQAHEQGEVAVDMETFFDRAQGDVFRRHSLHHMPNPVAAPLPPMHRRLTEIFGFQYMNDYREPHIVWIHPDGFEPSPTSHVLQQVGGVGGYSPVSFYSPSSRSTTAAASPSSCYTFAGQRSPHAPDTPCHMSDYSDSPNHVVIRNESQLELLPPWLVQAHQEHAAHATNFAPQPPMMSSSSSTVATSSSPTAATSSSSTAGPVPTIYYSSLGSIRAQPLPKEHQGSPTSASPAHRRRRLM